MQLVLVSTELLGHSIVLMLGIHQLLLRVTQVCPHLLQLTVEIIQLVLSAGSFCLSTRQLLLAVLKLSLKVPAQLVILSNDSQQRVRLMLEVLYNQTRHMQSADIVDTKPFKCMTCTAYLRNREPHSGC